MPKLTTAETVQLCETQPLLQVEDLCRITGFGQNQIYEAIKRGEWTSTRVLRVGRSIKIPSADVLDMLGLRYRATSPLPPPQNQWTCAKPENT